MVLSRSVQEPRSTLNFLVMRQACQRPDQLSLRLSWRSLLEALAHHKIDVDMTKPMHSYRVDSLLAVELRSWTAKEFGADIPIFELIGGTSFTGIGLAIAEETSLRQAARTNWVEEIE